MASLIVTSLPRMALGFPDSGNLLNDVDTNCPPLGPVYPAPLNLDSNELVKAASLKLVPLLNGLRGATNGTSLSVNIYSAHDQSPFLDYSSAPSNSSQPLSVTSDSVYRIGSVSKVITVLALILQGDKVRFDDPVSKYIPELRDDTTENPDTENDGYDDLEDNAWNRITIESLAAQLSGIGRDYGINDISPPSLTPAGLGLPSIDPNEITTCGGQTDQKPCSRGDFFKGILAHHPVYAPYQTPVYSNIAYTLLGYVIESVSQESYERFVQRNIFDKLGMRQSSVKTPRTVITPSEATKWSLDFGQAAPAVGIYSSAGDLFKLGRGILRNELISPTQTRRWLKPHSHTSSLFLSVGAPWEIARSSVLTQDQRVIDLYTKAGVVGSYSSLFVLIPDYDIGMTVLAAGGTPDMNQIADLSLKLVLPAIEQVGKQQAKKVYEGTYKSQDTSKPTTIVLKVDNGPGLSLEKWVNNGMTIYDSSNNPSRLAIRLYPTGLKSNPSKSSSPDRPPGQGISFRATSSYLPDKPESQPQGAETSVSVFSDVCGSWLSIDGGAYGNIAMDDLVFYLDISEHAGALDLRAERVILQRQ
ncbi:MAG: hypothetical protein M1829_000634 [Trizodia sp. TS-e1964]|nr:MAG: hypothetical protein M1829_000634 [Trizodia sp. TS-e1964]